MDFPLNFTTVLDTPQSEEQAEISQVPALDQNPEDSRSLVVFLLHVPLYNQQVSPAAHSGP